jgi:hypothetical protein
MHEEFDREEKIKRSSERSFGIVMAVVLGIFTFSPLLRQQPGEIRWWALGLCLIFLALALVWQAPLKPLNVAWTRLGLLLYHIVNPIVLGLLFFLTVTPLALLMRILGKNPLKLRRDPAASSYWIRREPPGPSPESMKNQF